MSIFQSSPIGNFTRGGQTAIHFIRMIWQVLSKFIGLTLFTVVIACGTFFWYETSPYQRQIAVKYVLAYVIVERLKRPNGSLDVTRRDGKTVTVKNTRILTHPGVTRDVSEVYRTLLWSLVVGALSSLLLLLLVGKFVYRFGSGQAKDVHIRGSQLVDARSLKKLVNRSKVVRWITLAGVPMPQGAEVAHTLLSGSPGGGKSTVLKEMLTGIRRRKERVVIYDSSGEYVSLFYRPGIDIILNPFDERSCGWDPWVECRHDYDYDRIAESLIPDRVGAGDPYWIMGARIVFAALMKKIASEPNPSNEKLVYAIMNLSIDAITHYVKHTEAAAIISEGGERMAISVRGVLATFTRSLKYLPTGESRFSIKDWVQDEHNDSWVFVTTKNSQTTALRPLISVWMDTAIAALASLEPSRNRRIWISIDELPGLNRLPSLTDGLAQLRKFGGCFILGIQSYSQLVTTYDKNGADTICSLCSTWCVFRFNDTAGAKFASENLGNSETVETTEGISFGASEIRDGVSLTKARDMRPIVLPTEIMNLEDLNGYLKFGRNLPVARIVAKHRHYPKVAEGFVDTGVEIMSIDHFVEDPDFKPKPKKKVKSKRLKKTTPDSAVETNQHPNDVGNGGKKKKHSKKAVPSVLNPDASDPPIIDDGDDESVQPKLI